MSERERERERERGKDGWMNGWREGGRQRRREESGIVTKKIVTKTNCEPKKKESALSPKKKKGKCC